MTLKELFDHSCTRYANRIAISFVDGTPLTYADMKHEVEKTSELLGRMNICRGDRVAILSGNMPNWGIAYFSIISRGAVVVPVLPDFHPDEVKNILQHSGSKAIFISEKLRHNIEDLQSKTMNHQIAIEDFSLISGELTDDPVAISELLKDTDTASIIYTSGTTGRSKGVMLSHRNITLNAEMCLQFHNVREDDVFLSILPLSHTYENTVSFILPIMMGSSIYYVDKPPTASVLIPALEKVKPTLMLSVPLIIEKIYRNQVQAKFTDSKLLKILYGYVAPFRKFVHYLAGKKLRKTFGGRLEFFGIGGAKLDPTVERFLREARFPYAIGYGLTETSPVLAGCNPSKVCHQAIGKVLEGVQVKIENPDPKTGVGEVLAKGETVMQGYYNEPELTSSVFTDDGWLRTGDLGYFDKHQRLFLKGRIKTMILGASGENIYPEDIESIINNFKGVLESLVLEQKGKLVAMVCLNMEELEKIVQQMHSNTIQFLSEKKEELIKKKEVLIKKKEVLNKKKEELNKKKDEINKQIDFFVKELKNHVNQHVNKYSQIHSVIIVPEPFEKTPTMKIKRYLYNSTLAI
jgi:long-chain acyl-CoA synthetase